MRSWSASTGPVLNTRDMAILATDILIKTMLEAGLNDLRKNPWVLDDIFSGLAQDPLSKVEYGYKEVKAAKDWFLSNNVPVYMAFRVDSPNVPCISIIEDPKQEKADRASLADDGSVEDYEPRRAISQPQYVMEPFTPAGYDPSTGIVTLPDSLNTDLIAPSQFFVSSKSGKAYQVKKILGSRDFSIKKNVSDDFHNAYIVPPTSIWNLHREQAFLSESFSIQVHAASDPVVCRWLREIVVYSLFRYREAYLEARGWEISSVSIGPIGPNPHFGSAEKVFTASITLEGTVEASWIKFIAPKLYHTRGEILIADGSKTPPGYQKQAKDQGWRMAADVEPDVPILGEDDPEDHE